ncbi:Uncharacterised protein [Bordetella pertussis]|nr:Uncharacterised protein [Bordetella pertussis]
MPSQAIPLDTSIATRNRPSTRVMQVRTFKFDHMFIRFPSNTRSSRGARAISRLRDLPWIYRPIENRLFPCMRCRASEAACNPPCRNSKSLVAW